jgi:hypothetical protein
MAANQVVLYFEKPEDALLFTLAASSVMSRRRGSPQQQGSGQGCTGNLQKPIESRLREHSTSREGRQN